MTAPMSVDPAALSATGATVGGGGDGIAAATGSLDSALSGAGAMFGHDVAGVVFGQSYTASGAALLDAAGSAVNACRRAGFGIQMSAANYGHANASSTVGGGTSPVPVPSAPANFSAPSMPPPLGDGIAAPMGWALVESFVGDVWPDGNPGELRAAAGAWRSFGTAMSGLVGQVNAEGPGLGAQQIPEAGQMVQAVAQVTGGLADISAQATTLATAVDGFADAVDSTQNAVRGLLQQLSLSGVLETIGGIFTGHNPIEKIREVAREITTVLDNMKREADATSELFSQGINVLDSATTSLEAWASKEFTQAFGQDVGGALSFGVNAFVDEADGAVKFVAETVQGFGQLDPTRFAYDPSGAVKTWQGMAESVAVMTNPALLTTVVAADPQGAVDTVKGVVDWKDVEAGHPFRAVGYNVAQAASALIPGVDGAEPTIIEGRVAGAEGRVASGVTREAVPGIGGASSAAENITTKAGRVSSDLDSVKVPESAPPGAAAGPSAPTGRPPVDTAGPTAESSGGGRGPVDTPPPASDAGPHVPNSEPVPEQPAPQSYSLPASDSAQPAAPSSGESAPAHVDPPPPPSSHTLEPAQIAESDPARPQSGGGSFYESAPAASEPSKPIGDSAWMGPGDPIADVSPALGADDKVPASVGAHAAESSEGVAGGSGHDSGGGSGHGSGGGSDGGSGHRLGDSSEHGPGPGDSLGRGDGDPSGPASEDRNGHGSSADHSGSEQRGEREDPVHSGERSGDGWHRVDDKPDDPHYGEPLKGHWSADHYPTPNEVTKPTFDLIKHPGEPYGHGADGHPYTKEEYEERYNKIGPEGQSWEAYPPNDGAVPGTRAVYNSGDAYLRDYGPHLDRIGDDSGSYLGVMPDGVPPAFEDRGLPISSLEQPFSHFILTALPEGWNIEVSQIAPAFGRDGGALQVLIYDEFGKKASVEKLLENGVLN